jgi:hypothetical protein
MLSQTTFATRGSLLDTTSLSNRINTKLSKPDTITLSDRIDTKLEKADTLSLSESINTKLSKSDTITLSNRIDTKLTKSDTSTLSSRIDLKLNTNDAFVGLKDTTGGVKSAVGINGFWFGDAVSLSVAGENYHPFSFAPGIIGICGIYSDIPELEDITCELQMITLCDNVSNALSDGSQLPKITLALFDTSMSFLSYEISILSDSSINVLNNGDYGLKILPSGALQSLTDNGTENVLTDYGTLSGTVWVTDSSGSKKYMTFTNGLLTASDLSGLADVFTTSPSENLTMTDFKKSPEYAEFLEFKRYLAMKQSFDNNNSTKGN